MSTLEQAKLLGSQPENDPEARLSSLQEQLEWSVVSKATTQTYGLILNTLLEQTIPLSGDIGYWNEVLGSYKYTSLYTVQTSPLRLWAWGQDIYADAVGRFQSSRSTFDDDDGDQARSASIPERWRQFYGLVKDSIRDRSLADMQSKVLSPLTQSRMEAMSKRKHLKKLREMSASGLGILIDEGMIFDADEEGSISSRDHSNSDDWRSVVTKSVSLMETVLANVTMLELGTSEMEETVFRNVDDDPDSTQHDTEFSQTRQLASRLEHILEVHIPRHITATEDLTKQCSKPNRLIRYWLPGLVLFLSSSTLLRMFVHRKAEIVNWVRDFGTTTIDFWNNWVVEPLKKVIGTIRHDKDSEIAIMSKDSLQGDKASLERMVVDFAVDNPNNTTGSPLTDMEIANVRAKVRQGDLTPVLMAYEKDLRKPFMGTVRGDLIRALLIQIQKTKVDVEIAIGGIDSLLKSQELVFGFIGLTPGVLVCFGLLRWLNSLGKGQGLGKGSIVRLLRNIDRLLSSSTSNNGMLIYKDHGMLLCQVHILRQRAHRILPGDIYNEFLEDINELSSLHTGIERQIHVVERIRWAYSQWLH